MIRAPRSLLERDKYFIELNLRMLQKIKLVIYQACCLLCLSKREKSLKNLLKKGEKRLEKALDTKRLIENG